MYVHAMQCDDLQPLNKNPSLRLLHLKNHCIAINLQEKCINLQLVKISETKVGPIIQMDLTEWCHAQFYIQLVFKAPLCITLTISDQKIVSGSLFFQLFSTFSKKKIKKNYKSHFM
jgi:hypothetical protein